MPRRALSGLMFALLLHCSWALKAQQTEKPLTNADVLSMVKAGLPESTIVLAIQLASRRGSADLDASPSALMELKSGGATETILNAVLGAQAGKPLPPESPVPGLPARFGVYYRGPSGWTALPSCLLWPGFGTSLKLTTGFWGEDNVMVLPGSEARLQVPEQRPTFHVRGQPEREWLLLWLVKKRTRREVWMVPGDVFAAEIKFRESHIREVELTTLGRDVFTIAPRADLDPGEYLLCTEVPAARRLLQCYEFGVRLEKPAEGPGAI